MMLKRSTIQLLRFPFSFFLMPVFFFALSCAHGIQLFRVILIFCIIHLLVYPSSNGYNSYMDKDTDSIGGVKAPMLPEKELFYVTLVLDALAIIISMYIPGYFNILLLCYIICSRLYSYRGIRLKKFPVIGYMTVILNQGGLMFFLVYSGVTEATDLSTPWLGILASCFLIGGFYPITQVYQHVSDEKDGVKTISMLLGKRGTFIFCAAMYTIAFAILLNYYNQQNKLWYFGILQIFFLPVLVYFFSWVRLVWKNPEKADFEHTMKMNWIAASFTNLGFITLLIMNYIG